MKARPPLDRLPDVAAAPYPALRVADRGRGASFASVLAAERECSMRAPGNASMRNISHFRYTAVDLGIGDGQWSYGRLDAVGDLLSLPFADGTFDAALNVVTLEHVTDPAQVVAGTIPLSEAGRPSAVDHAYGMGGASAAS